MDDAPRKGGWQQVPAGSSWPARPPDPAKSRAAEDEEAEARRLEAFVPVEPKRKLSDLIVPNATLRRIYAALARYHHHRTLYEAWNLRSVDPRGAARVAINLIGPPGTGKSYCAEAIAEQLGKSIIFVNYADVESKFVGDTPKNITAAFTKARSTGSVLFFDEADSILGRRLTSVTQSADHSVNVSRSVMLLQLDRFDGICLFATNLAQNYDPAFVRRILAHIEFELPDEPTRRRLWAYLMPTEVPRALDVTPEWLAASSAGLAGGDILNVVLLAAAQAVAREVDRKVLRSDVEQAIHDVRLAMAKVGSGGQRAATAREQVLEPEALPPHVQEALASRRAPTPDKGGADGEPIGPVPD